MAFQRSDTLEKVISIVTDKLHVDRATVNEASTFQDLGADSLAMVEIIMRLEEEFGIQINDEDAEQLTSVDEVVDYIHERRTK